MHLAALSNDPVGNLDPALTFAINHEATVRLAEVARARGVERFVFASSCSMYGASGSTSAIDESALLAPLTAYANEGAKRAVSGALANDEFSPVFLRFATAYGALRACDSTSSSTTSWDGPWRRVRVRLQSDGNAWRPLIHVQDMARAICAALRAPRERVHCVPFNTGATEANYLVRDLALLVGEVVPGANSIELAPGTTSPTSSARSRTR